MHGRDLVHCNRADPGSCVYGGRSRGNGSVSQYWNNFFFVVG